jgi:serine/threonine protein kinase
VDDEDRVRDGVRRIAEVPYANFIKVLEIVPSGDLVKIGFFPCEYQGHETLGSVHSSLSETEKWIVIFHTLFALQSLHSRRLLHGKCNLRAFW